MKIQNFIQKLLASVALSTMLVFSSVVMSGAQAYTKTTYVLTIKGKDYYPERSKSYPSAQADLMEKIVAAKKYDNMIFEKYQKNPKLIPFTDQEYRQVFKNNDAYLYEIVVNRNYNSKILNTYLDYYQNMLQNMKKNRDLFSQRSDDVEMLNNIDDMYNKLTKQQESQSRFFNQLKNIRGL